MRTRIPLARRLATWALIISICCSPLLAVERAGLGRSEKLRVLVDKTLMRANDWYMTEDNVREIAAAGFNVVSPRIGGNDLARVHRVTALAGKYGIYHIPWMRGTLTTTDSPASTRLVYSNGHVANLFSPNSDELWDWTHRLIIGYAQISIEEPALIGVFLDYEVYDRPKFGNAYALSYDAKIMADFAAAQDVALPELAPEERSPWLKEQGLHDEFDEFQVAHWRERCRTLREAVDAINPTFQFCVYPAPGSKFMREAVYPEWATGQAPLILADAITYGRGASFVSHRNALLSNHTMLRDRMAQAQEATIPLMYMGGLDPVCTGADPEFLGKSAVMSAEATDGYWVFYEGPEYDDDHPAYFRWFTRANEAITAANFGFWRQPRETPDEYDTAATIEPQSDKLQVGLYGTKPRIAQMLEATGRFETHALAGIRLEYLRQLDVIVLQNLNIAIPMDSNVSKALRRYVWQGGGLMLAHDTAWFMESPFPQIAVRDVPTHNVEAGRHVVETDLVVSQGHEVLGTLQPGVKFTPEFRDHMIFQANPRGTVIIDNEFGDPVYVIGTYGKGRVCFSGSYYGYTKDLEGGEREAFLAIMQWLSNRAPG